MLHLVLELRIAESITLQFEKDNIGFDGNLDVKKIQELAESLGINLSEPHYKRHLHGKVFIDIKNNRNSLAHGNKSFCDIGKDISYLGDGQDGTRGLGLVHFKNYAFEHLQSFINNIDDYLKNEKYLKT